MACFNDLKSFLFPPFRAQAEFGKNKIAKFGRGGRFFRIFRPKFGFCPLGPRVIVCSSIVEIWGAFGRFRGRFHLSCSLSVSRTDGAPQLSTLWKVFIRWCGLFRQRRTFDECEVLRSLRPSQFVDVTRRRLAMLHRFRRLYAPFSFSVCGFFPSVPFGV